MRDEHFGQFHVIDVDGALVPLYPATVLFIPVGYAKAPPLIIHKAVKGNLAYWAEILCNFYRSGKLLRNATTILRMLFLRNTIHRLVVDTVLFVTPFKRLGVKIAQIMERSALGKISFYELNKPLDSPFFMSIVT